MPISTQMNVFLSTAKLVCPSRLLPPSFVLNVCIKMKYHAPLLLSKFLTRKPYALKKEGVIIHLQIKWIQVSFGFGKFYACKSMFNCNTNSQGGSSII